MSEVDTLPQEPVSSVESPPEINTAASTSTALQPANANNTMSVTQTENGDMVQTYINADGKRVKKIIRKKRRPARPQVDPATFKTEPPPQTGTIFNIWYNKWSGGDREDKYLSKTHAPSRCNVQRDTGYTRADDIPGSYFCLFFARGICPRGRDCEYLHRLPGTFDVYSGNVDCFGRDKHSDYRDDMGGVGSFMRQNRTLYCGRIHPTSDIEEVVARHFSEWGPVERTRVLPQRGVAFITYTTESLAQFAKEAMAHQSLDNEEILNVRWATQDPNPVSQKREVKMIEEQAAEAIRRALPEEFVREIEGDEGARKRRKEEGSFGLKGYAANDEVWFESEKRRMQIEDSIRQDGSGTAIQSAPEKRLIESVPAESVADSNTAAVGTSSAPGGIFDASTLAAVQSYRPARVSQNAGPSKGTAGTGLVGYDSSDEE